MTWLSYDLTELWLHYYLTELLLDWAMTWLSYDLLSYALLLDWAITWLHYYLTELLLDWAMTWLSYDLTELWLHYYLTELLLDWAMTWLSYDLLSYALLLDWAITWLHYYLTELWLDWAIELRSHSYIGSFSTKLPLIIWEMFPLKKLDNYFCKNINWRNKEFNILLMEKSLNMSGNKTTKSYPWKKTGNKVSNLVHGKFKKRK